MDKAIVAEMLIGNNVVIGFGEEAPNVLKPCIFLWTCDYRRNSVIPDSVKSVRIQHIRCYNKKIIRTEILEQPAR